MSIDLTLNRIRSLLSHLPPYKRPTCHIAGTNGKGSVAAILSSILLASSPPLSVGRFNSPHLVSVLDSISINNRPVGVEEYAKARGEVEEIDRRFEVGASRFELLTSTALMIFEKKALDVVVLEVGVGGRSDATNVIPDESVLVSALTAVDLDHQALLGGTVAAIAEEKAGIARKGKPLVLGKQRHEEVRDVVKNVVVGIGGYLVDANNATSRAWEENIDGPHPQLSSAALMELHFRPVTISMPCFTKPVLARFPLYGDHQLENLGVASSIVSQLVTHPSYPHLRGRISPASVAQGLESTSWPGRLSFHSFTACNGKKTVILADGAHNAASAATLSKYISSLLSRVSVPGIPCRKFHLTYILGLSHAPPKSPRDTLEPLFSSAVVHPSGLDVRVNVAAVEFTPPEDMPWVKHVPAAEIGRVVTDLKPDAELWTSSKDSRLRSALEWAASVTGNEEDGLVVVAGSLYLVADFYRELQGVI